MSEETRGITAPDVDGPAAPPRSNGELVFEAPWESRVFGLTLALFEGGHFEWDEFRELLIDEIARFESRADPGEAYRYYVCWQSALERLLDAKGLCASESLAERETWMGS